MSTTDNLESQRQNELRTAQGMIDKAKSEDRALTDDERTAVKTHITVADQLASRITVALKDHELFEQVTKAIGDDANNGGGFDDGRARGKFRTLGESFIKSEVFKTAATYARTGGQFSTQAYDTGISLPDLRTLGQGRKDWTAGTPVYAGGFQEGPLVVPQLNRPVVADLLASGTMSGSLFTYLEEDARTNNAATVAESGRKPESKLSLARKQVAPAKIATVLHVPDELLDDLDAARSYIDGRLTLFIQQEEEEQLLYGDGTAPNLTGILETNGIQTETAADAADNFDALYRAITKVRVNAFVEPDAIVMNPMDYQFIRLLSDAVGQFYGGGPFTGAYGNGSLVNDPDVWGLRTVLTPAITQGTAVVGAWQAGGQVLRKSGITIEATNSHADNFVQNITTLRAEERLALAVYLPAAFCSVTLKTT